MNYNLLYKLYDIASFSVSSQPSIVVLRNTGANGSHIPDTGDNCCDTVVLVGKSSLIALSGRSIPHRKYQAQQMAGTANVNKIASGYYSAAFRKGFHRGYKALVQNRAFTIWRSLDMIYGNADDYIQNAIVADNFHGYAPYSAGCITVEGAMDPPSGGWERALNWIYKTHERDTYFNAILFEHDDLSANAPRLRIGSTGEPVLRLQKNLTKLGLPCKADADFGPWTHMQLRIFQSRRGITPSGIMDDATASALEEAQVA